MLEIKTPIRVNIIISDLHNIAMNVETLRSAPEFKKHKDSKHKVEELDNLIRYAGNIAAVLYQRASTYNLKKVISE